MFILVEIWAIFQILNFHSSGNISVINLAVQFVIGLITNIKIDPKE